MSMQATEVASHFDNPAQQDHAAALGLWIFLATELLFFGPLFFAYLYGRTHFSAAFAAASRHTDVMLGTLNTAILLTSSLAMAIAVAASEAACDMERKDRESRGNAGEGSIHGASRMQEEGMQKKRMNEPVPRNDAVVRLALWSLAATAVLGIVFLVIKGSEYVHEWHEHLIPGAGFDMPASVAQGGQYFFFLYFAMTGLHAVHLAIGIAMVGSLAMALYRRKERFASARHIRLAGLYWHFVDVVWIFLYPLLYLVSRSGT